MAPKTGAIFVLEVSLALQRRPPSPPPSGGRALQKSPLQKRGVTCLPDLGNASAHHDRQSIRFRFGDVKNW
jgi:hypothetical protein